MAQTSYRETVTAPSSRNPDRYLASDFKRLTTRRFTTPNSTPDCVEVAHESPAERPKGATADVGLSDKRAPIPFTSSIPQARKPSASIAQGSSGQSSRCSSIGDTCVKEDNSGQLPPLCKPVCLGFYSFLHLLICYYLSVT